MIKVICQWSFVSAIAILLGAVPGSAIWTALSAEASTHKGLMAQFDWPDQPNHLPTQQIFMAEDATLHVAPDPRATVTGQITAGTPVRVTHQSNRYFYIEVSNLGETQDAESVKGWVSGCQLYGECE